MNRPRAPKGHRPYVTGEPHAERVLSIAMAVATDVAALHERLDTVIRLAGRGEPFTMADVEGYAPTPEVNAERDEWREAYLSRLLRIMYEMVPERGDNSRAYSEFVREIALPADAAGDTTVQPARN